LAFVIDLLFAPPRLAHGTCVAAGTLLVVVAPLA